MDSCAGDVHLSLGGRLRVEGIEVRMTGSKAALIHAILEKKMGTAKVPIFVSNRLCRAFSKQKITESSLSCAAPADTPAAFAAAATRRSAA
jgi:hypothetical protein